MAEVELKEPPLPELACVIKAGTCIEASLQRGKREVGMDAYQVRTWQGWHHHIALSPTFKGCLQRIDISGQFLELRTDVSEKFPHSIAFRGKAWVLSHYS